MLHSVPEFAKARHWTSCEVNGQIYVWYHCDGIDPEWLVPEQPEISKGEWVYRGRTEHFINAHIQVSGEKPQRSKILEVEGPVWEDVEEHLTIIVFKIPPWALKPPFFL